MMKCAAWLLLAFAASPAVAQVGVGGGGGRSVWFGAAAASADATNCADPAEVTIGSWGKAFSIICTDNDASVMTWTFGMPDGWDAGTLTFELQYIQDAADTNVLNADVAARCVGATETPAAYGTEVAIDDGAPNVGFVSAVHETEYPGLSPLAGFNLLLADTTKKPWALERVPAPPPLP